MDYRIELYDPWGRRRAAYDEVDLLEVVHTTPDQAGRVRGLLPVACEAVGPAWRVRVLLDGAPVTDAEVVSVSPEWSDLRKLILDRYVPFHEVLAFDAVRPANTGNTRVSRAYTNQEIGAMLRHIVNSAPGPVHYWVDHAAYPDGAQREHAKFLARKTAANELEHGGIETGDWVGADRIDASGACAKDGDTVAGLVVDGAPWPDLRLMMIDAEETSRNSHGVKRHPEVADWSDARYAVSGYKRRADAATALLQQLLDTKGIGFIELNPHRNADGHYDDRVDAYGRYIGLLHGGGECFNAALVEHGLADVYLYQDGRYHVPEMALKDFYSYRDAHADSVAATGVSLAEFDATGGVFEMAAALAAAAGCVFDVDLELGVSLRPVGVPDRTCFFDPVRMGAQLGFDAAQLANYLYVEGNPFTGAVAGGHARNDSIDAYGLRSRRLAFFSLSREEDAALLAGGLLADLAYPAPAGELTFFGGDATVRVGGLVEVRGAPLRRRAPELPDEWDGRYTGRFVGRVCEVRHRMHGRHVTTRARLTSPLRSVASPLSYIVRSQESASSLFAFRLDDLRVGLDMGFHLD